MSVDRRCLSLTRPWEQVILHGPKRIENRKHPPPPAVLGQHVLLHAARSREDGDGLDFIAARWPGFDRALAHDPAGIGLLVGAARIVGCTSDRDDPWYTGPWGWVLTDVVAFDRPLGPVRGMLGCWRVPEALRDEAEAALDLALRAARDRQC